MKKVVLIFILICSLTIIKSLFANDRAYINFNGATIQLGMTKKVVTECLLRNGRKLTSLRERGMSEAEEDNFLVIPTYSSTQYLPPSTGQIIFRNNKTVFISKDWKSFNSDRDNAHSFIEALNSVLSNTMESQKRTVTIMTETFQQPTYEVKHIYLHIAPYDIQISSLTGKPLNTIHISKKLIDHENYP